MENSKFETLNLPPYRRRHLRSQTVQSLLRIISIFDDDDDHDTQYSQPHPSNLDSGSPESEAANKTDGHCAHAKVVSDELLRQNDSLTDENRGVSGMQEKNLHNAHGVILESDHMLKNKELAHGDNTNLVKSMGNRDSSLLRINLDEQSIVSRVLHIEECTPHTELDSKLPTHEKCDDVTMSLNEDKMVTLNPSVNNNENNLSVDMKALEEVKDDRQGTGMTLDKPTLASGVMHSSVTAGEEAEEGEISGESIGLSPEDDISSEGKRGNEGHFSEDVSGKEQQTGLDKDGKSNPWTEDITGNLGKEMESEIREPKRNLVEYNSEIFTHVTNVKSSKLNVYRCKPKTGGTNKQGSVEKESDAAGVCLKNLVQVGGASGENASKYLQIASVKKGADVSNERKRPTPQAKENRANKKICTSQDKSESVAPVKPIEPLKTEGYDSKLENVRKKNEGSGVKNSGDPQVCPEKLSSLGVLSAETQSQNKVIASTEKDDDVPEKKRKRVLTKERRAKKKQKAKMKLAEKNGKPAVRRPQLQPVAKQKAVAPCRHYLYGRCKEGALCNFSHDTIPLTKSTPCSHFARHSCMKGDQCPFDHELSKYTCNNFLAKGSCSRGVDCLFSHKMPANEGAVSASKATGPDLLALSLLDNSSSLKRFIVNEKLDAKSSPIALSPGMNTQQNVAVTTPKQTLLSPKGTVTTPKPTALAPKGAVTTPKPVAAAPKGMSFLSHRKLLQDAVSTPKADAGVKVDHQLTPNSILVQNNNENTKKTPTVAPRGINFLAFGKKPLVDVSNSSLSLKRNDGIGKSPLSNFCEGERPYSSLKKNDGVKVDNLVNQIPLDGSNCKSQVDIHSDKDTAAPVLLQEKTNAHGKFQIPNAVLQPPLSATQTPSFQKMILPNTPMSLHNVLKSTLAFASKFESGVKTGQSFGSPVVRRDSNNKEAGSSSTGSTKASSILDFLYGHSSKS